MPPVSIVLTLTLAVVVAPTSTPSGAVNTHPYGLDPHKRSDAPLLTNFETFVARAYLLELRTDASPVGHGPLRFQDSPGIWSFERVGPVFGRAHVGE